MKKILAAALLAALALFALSRRDGGGDFSKMNDTLVSAISENPVAAEVFSLNGGAEET